jgi:hypothetical protein
MDGLQRLLLLVAGWSDLSREDPDMRRGTLL